MHASTHPRIHPCTHSRIHAFTHPPIHNMKLFPNPNTEIDYSALGADLHSHLIPGIDDGAKDLAHSLELIGEMYELGYRKIITTPHIFWDFHKNTAEKIKRGEEQVLEALEKTGWDIQFSAAAEYYLDDHFLELLRKGELLTLKDRLILVETSKHGPIPNLHEMIFEINMKGYRPVLAHPERYLYLADRIEVFHRIREWGCDLQLNMTSLDGYYGEEVKGLAERLLKEGLIDFLGTDLHHHVQMNHLKNLKGKKFFGKLLKARWKNRELMERNASE
jgi:protein-tyrosine phosphatase